MNHLIQIGSSERVSESLDSDRIFERVSDSLDSDRIFGEG